MSVIGKFLAAVIALAISAFVAGSVFAPGLTSSLLGQALGQEPAAEQTPGDIEAEAEAITGDPYPGDPDAESQLVDAEAVRLVAVRTAASAGASQALNTALPFLVATEGRPTLILPARAEPYTLAELATLSPTTVTTDGPDGGFVLREHVAVMSGAVLGLGAGDALWLASDTSGFSSVVALGGTVEAHGSADRRVQISSWDPATGAADETTADGRAYIRVDGGSLTIENTDVSALGFWSADTGGIAYDGRTSPELRATPPAAAEGGVPTMTLEPVKPRPGTLEVSGTVVRGNVFGLTVAGVADPVIADSDFSRSLADGLVLDREVSGAAISGVAASANARDGIRVSPSCSSTTLAGLDIQGNARNGLVLDGRPVAEGPNPSGAPTTPSDGSSVDGGTFSGNARIGIDVIGGTGIDIRGVHVSGGDMGIVLDDGPRDVAISQAQIDDVQRHGISVRDDARQVTVSANRISGVELGIYLRNADAEVRDNVVSSASIHGIALSGRLDGSLVTGNRVSGTGPTAIDADRAIDARVEGNLVDGWAASRSLEQILTTVMQPLTIVWTLVVTIVIVALITRLGGGRKRGDPLRDPRPLQSLSRGIVSRADAGQFSGR
jgi:parallel beta-helix repeat protein